MTQSNPSCVCAAGKLDADPGRFLGRSPRQKALATVWTGREWGRQGDSSVHSLHPSSGKSLPTFGCRVLRAQALPQDKPRLGLESQLCLLLACDLGK